MWQYGHCAGRILHSSRRCSFQSFAERVGAIIAQEQLQIEQHHKRNEMELERRMALYRIRTGVESKQERAAVAQGEA